MKEVCPECKVHRGHKQNCSLQHTSPAVKEQDFSIEAYRKFLREKTQISADFGVPVQPSDVHPWLKPHQRVAVEWAVRGGRRALFESFGLGKTVQQLEILRITIARAGGRALIVAPLGVRQEFMQDAERVGIVLKFVRSIEECEPTGLYLTNYETVRDGKLDPAQFTAASLDEASILRGFGGTKTFREFMRLFESVPYRFVATATPDPNEYIELLAYAAFLGIMDVSQAKTRFFKRDSTKADKLTIHPHKQQEFALWLASWALFLPKPSDLGPEFSDEGYDLPPLEIVKHEIRVEHTDVTPERDGQGRMFREAKHGVVDAAREKRDTLQERVAELVKIIRDEVLNNNGQEGVQLGVLPEKPRGSTEKAAGEREGVLPEEQRDMRCEIETLERTESGTIQGGDLELFREKPGEDHRTEPRVVCEQQRPGQFGGTPLQTQAIRPDAGILQTDAEFTERQLSGMPQENAQPGSGPRSSDGASQRPAVQNMQCGNRTTAGRSGNPSEGGRILGQFIVWCDLNAEQRSIDKALAAMGISYSSLYGSENIEDREERLQMWRDRKTTAFVSKPSMYGAGVNLQQCNEVIFVGIGFKFSEFFQAIKRVHRFLQTRSVRIHLIYAESERLILQTLMAKWEQFDRQSEHMSEVIRQYGLSQAAISNALARSMGVERQEVSSAGPDPTFRLINNDCVEELEMMPANSAHLILTSVPFSTQYEYTPSYNDFGHTDGNSHFWQQMDFLTPRLMKVLRPGRWCCIHVKDRIVPGGITGLGFQTVYPFHVDAIQHFTRHGFAYMGMKTIVTDVVRENNQTYRLGWTEQCKDATKMGVGMPEYLLLFRKPPTETINSYADEPVVKQKKNFQREELLEDGGILPAHWQNPQGYSRARWQIDAHAFMRSNGNRPLMPEDLDGVSHATIFKLFRKYSLEHVYDFEHHVKLGEYLEEKGILPVTFMLLQPQSWNSEVWTDITRMRTLNGAQSAKGRELHLCPLQFDLADRVIKQLSMEGETILDPFGGLGTVAMKAVEHGRRGLSIELNTAYWYDSITYCKAAEEKRNTPTLFDLIQEEETIAE